VGKTNKGGALLASEEREIIAKKLIISYRKISTLSSSTTQPR
jgi:hypothetical protein